MPVSSIELRPRGPVALLDAAVHLCVQDSGLWTLALTGGALVTAAVFHLTEAARLHHSVAVPSLLLALAWFTRGLCQGAACHYVEQLVLEPAAPSPWRSLKAALGRAPSLFIAVAVIAAIDTLGLVFTLGLGFFFLNAHLAGYAAAMRGVGHPLGLYRTCSRLLGGAAGGSLLWIRIAFWAQLLLAINLHIGANVLVLLGRSLLALDLSFANRYASVDNAGWLLTLAALTFALTEPLRAAVAALLLIDGRVRQEGLDLVAALEQLPRRQRPGRLAAAKSTGVTALLLLALCLPGAARAQWANGAGPREEHPTPAQEDEAEDGEDVDTREGSSPPAQDADEDGDSAAAPAPEAAPRPRPPPRSAPGDVDETVSRLSQVIEACGDEDPQLRKQLEAARQLGPRERAPLTRLLSVVESDAYDEDDCDTARAHLASALPYVARTRDALAAQAAAASSPEARDRAQRILARPEFIDEEAPAAAPEEKPAKQEEPSWWTRFKKWLREWLEKRDEQRPLPPPTLSPGTGQGVAQVLAVVLGGAGLLVLAYLLFSLRKRPKKADAALEVLPAGIDADTGTGGQNALSRPPEGWASLADQLAARGDFRAALRSLYLATLSRLHRDGAIDYDPALSNWEYFRRFRGPREWVPPFRELTNRFDYAFYGHADVDSDGYHRFRELSAPILTAPPAAAAEASRA